MKIKLLGLGSILAITLSINACAAVEAIDCLQTGDCEDLCASDPTIVDCSEIKTNKSVMGRDSTLSVSKLPVRE